jgi:hypothetical protein
VVWVSAALFFPCKIMARCLHQLPSWQQYNIFQTLDELELEDTVGHTTLALQQLYGLGTEDSKVHHRPSTCASAASVCGNQKVMSMA